MKNIGVVVLITLFLLGLAPQAARAQGYETQWISIGSLQNWYANMGAEIEEGRVKKQQDGLQWEAIYANQDMQAAKGLAAESDRILAFGSFYTVAGALETLRKSP